MDDDGRCWRSGHERDGSLYSVDNRPVVDHLKSVLESEDYKVDIAVFGAAGVGEPPEPPFEGSTYGGSGRQTLGTWLYRFTGKIIVGRLC